MKFQSQEIALMAVVVPPESMDQGCADIYTVAAGSECGLYFN